jgi:methylglutaconyl-CoA hydratase
MDYSTIAVTMSGRTATVSLNRPDRRNALDEVMMKELADALASVDRNSDVRIVVLTGEGPAFCAGMDLEHLRRYAAKGHEENLEDARRLKKLLEQMYTMKKPLVAMVNGPAMGGGCGLAAVCDFVFAARTGCRLGAPEVRIGFVPALILPFLIRRMGEGRAREFVLRGEILDAASAQARGLVTYVADDADLRSEVADFCEEFCASTSGSSVMLTKDLLARMSTMDLHEALEYAANLNALSRKTEDFQRGLGAFLRKEKIVW